MIGIVIVAHGGLAHELAASLEHIVGKQENLCSIGIYPDDDLELRRNELHQIVQSCNLGKGIIILTDLFGGTPSNLAIAMMKENNVEVIAGVNLPLLVRLAKIRSSHEIKKTAQLACEGGKKYIVVASELLQGNSNVG